MTSAEDDICSICRDVVAADGPDTYSIPECNHRFHSNCIIPWFRVSNGTCPYCRAGIVGVSAGPSTIKQVVQLWKCLARRKDCPRIVKRKCKQIRQAKEVEKEAKRELAILKREHHEAMATWNSLRRKKWRSILKARRLERQLAFLPPGPIMRYLMPVSVRS